MRESRSSNDCFFLVVGSEISFSMVMLWVGSAIPETIRYIWARSLHTVWYSLRALNDVSTTLLGSCLPFPSFNFAFYTSSLRCCGKKGCAELTEKSAAFSRFFLEPFGIVSDREETKILTSTSLPSNDLLLPI